jgi:hypothetical protein
VSAPRHMRSDELDLDYSERAGFMTGKSAAIADWRHRKEVRDFGALVNRLRVIKWQRENAEKHHAKQLRYALKAEVKARYNANARKRRAAKPIEQLVCEECREPFPRARRGPRPRFCGDACRQRATYQARTPGARRTKLHADRVERRTAGRAA